MPSSSDRRDAYGRIAWSKDDVRSVLRVPGRSDDKRSRGTVALRTGSEAYPGAAVLGVEAAWRAGAGYVRYFGPRRPADLVLARRPETVVTDPAHDAVVPAGAVHADAWVIGSGTDAAARTAQETAALRILLAGSLPVVVDAGALELLPAAAPVIATPHAGEFARLRAVLGLSALADGALVDPVGRARAVQETADMLGGIVLLKGATTLVAGPSSGSGPGPGVGSDVALGAVLAVDAGTGWLATAGTGDVLAGMIGALVAADRAMGAVTPLSELAASAAWLHGRAGRIAADVDVRGSGHPIVALDVAAALPAAFARALAADPGADRGLVDGSGFGGFDDDGIQEDQA